jgi:hypothetical protein
MNVEVVKEYYGKVLKTSKDLKTSICCDGGGVPAHLEPLLANVHEDVRAKYYGPASWCRQRFKVAASSISALAPAATFI